MQPQITETNLYRFAWLKPGETETQYGSFLFNEPADARDAEKAMQKAFAGFVIWLEDQEHNRVQIPR